ncbi:hypothetical protein CDO52_20315 [Nocardiopsis gilva YIM 90087]|uniref:Bifunctional folylpolyglutamate synthase/dihydrofolate synthase n=1 Tax=Nocardiopsis gilva YIM 90087 TaxID=1235441 RepID=A0A223S9R9_9ACTN|nr:hypothetical protein [Nocardiopsis gilva]ASU84829.1 hypothetical protein CDO52_20315 [Nocardiopsis gilva YIM 90087]
MPSFETFFSEWRLKRQGYHRSLSRALDLRRELDISEPPVLGVVGSKGKGTTATYASACLAAAGLNVVTVTGPSFRSHRERVRFNGVAIDEAALDEIAQRIEKARERLGPPSEDGYLSPNALFMTAGLLEAERRGADVCVVEAGIGGHRDELRLLEPRVVAMAKVFAEHVGLLGDTVAEIAWEKARVAGERTEGFVRLAQTEEVAEVVDRAVAEVTSGRVRPDVVRPGSGQGPAPEVLPPGLSAASAELGCAAAERMLAVLGQEPASPERLHGVLSSLRLPARLSRHTVGGTELLIDSAINRTGIQVALEHARRVWPRVDHALICFPDHKDVDGAIAELGSIPVTFARLPEEHLRFEHDRPAAWNVIEAAALTQADITALGEHVLVLGTVYFTGRVLDVIDAETERLFSA